MKVLQGVRILDLGNFITAPLAGMLLGELGADVIKVERPGAGDPFRAFKGGLYSPQFQAHNRNKRSLSLDYARPEGLAVLDRLIAGADAIILNMRPGVEEKLGLGAPRLQALNPRLVYCAITGFGASGPYASRPAYDNVGQAASGWLSMFHAGADPKVAGPAVSDAVAGIYASLGVLGALVERARTGRGRKVEVSMLEAMIAMACEPLGSMLATGRAPSLYGRAAMSQSYVVTCRDGRRIGLHLSSPEKFWRGLAAAIDRPDLLAAYPSRAERIEGYAELAATLAQVFAEQDREYWVPRLERHDVPFTPERRLDELADDPQVRHQGVFYEQAHPRHGTLRAAHRPIRYDGDNRSDFLPPPDLGEHTDDVLREAGLSDEELRGLRQAGVV
ncbi:CaiB/BaiF CoA transferase family protein [Bordetella petrii]|uniref:CaiB/BaiF CoA transferase family protein n=1 Tax=Bordetella petrii TaxID=94624 RepID=UPI001A97A20F|nr:CoA transferase [Bordetella petrii]MBO1114077.1 CoA transferase [Bordetella petrii]